MTNDTKMTNSWWNRYWRRKKNMYFECLNQRHDSHQQLSLQGENHSMVLFTGRRKGHLPSVVVVWACTWHSLTHSNWRAYEGNSNTRKRLKKKEEERKFSFKRNLNAFVHIRKTYVFLFVLVCFLEENIRIPPIWKTEILSLNNKSEFNEKWELRYLSREKPVTEK